MSGWEYRNHKSLCNHQFWRFEFHKCHSSSSNPVLEMEWLHLDWFQGCYLVLTFSNRILWKGWSICKAGEKFENLDPPLGVEVSLAGWAFRIVYSQLSKYFCKLFFSWADTRENVEISEDTSLDILWTCSLNCLFLWSIHW